MKLLQLLFLLVALCEPTHVNGAQTSRTEIRIDGLKRLYHLDEPQSFVVRNLSGVELVYYVTIQGKIDGEWRDLYYTIDTSSYGKSIALSKLPSRGSERITFRSVEHKFIRQLPIGSYRFVVRFSFDPASQGLFDAYSEVFDVL